MDPFMGRASELSGRIKEKASREYRVSNLGHELGGLCFWMFHGLPNWNIWHNWLKIRTRWVTLQNKRDEMRLSVFLMLLFDRSCVGRGETRRRRREINYANILMAVCVTRTKFKLD